jgi:sugar diacid utilization regulator/putative methionine-R-sulfoxide reductase with GAF domain
MLAHMSARPHAGPAVQRPDAGDETPRRSLGRKIVAKSYGPDFLYQIIEVISSGPDLQTILHGFVPLVTAATDCHGCFIYFVEDGQLVLRKASAGYARLEGRVRLSLDEGLAGWVARTRRSAFIRDRALEDPRVVNVPELDEDQYQSLVAVPILSRAGQAIGVINLHARAPHEFRKADLAFLENSAALIAGAIENARLYEEAIRRVELLTGLSRLAQEIASAASMPELLRALTAGCRKLLGGSRCELYLAGSDERLELAASDPPRETAPVLDARHMWSLLIAAANQDGDATRGLSELLWGKVATGTPLFAALTAGAERVGLLGVIVEASSADRLSLVTSIASHTAVAVRRRQLIESLEQKTLLKDFFEGLASGHGDPEWLRGQAAQLRCDLEDEHIVVQATPWARPVPPNDKTKAERRSPDWREVATRLEARLKSELPRSLFDQRDNSLRALLRLPRDGADAVIDSVRQVYQSLGGGADGPLAIGLSNPCRGASAITKGFEEAGSAAQVGALLRGGAGVFAYEQLGAYRYVVTAEKSVRDRYQDRLQRLVAYEERRGTALLGTLEAFVENLGSITRTARALHTHPNTVRQRLSRIEQLAELDLVTEDWLSLGMAIKIVKLRMIRGSEPTTIAPEVRGSGA